MVTILDNSKSLNSKGGHVGLNFVRKVEDVASEMLLIIKIKCVHNEEIEFTSFLVMFCSKPVINFEV